MKTYIALFRGINVGGRNSLPMKALTAILEDLGACNVHTYIQSGNVVFEVEDKDAAALSEEISAAIRERRGFEPRVLLLAPEDLQKAIAGNPFPGAESDPRTLHVGFLAAAPQNPDLEKLENLRKDSERFELVERFFYLHAPEGVGRSKLGAGSEKALGVPLTDRNWRTVMKIQEMLEALT